MNQAEQIYLRHTRSALTVTTLQKDIQRLQDNMKDAADAMDEAAARLAETLIQCEHTMAEAREINMVDMEDELEIYHRQLIELADDADQGYQACEKIERAFKQL